MASNDDVVATPGLPAWAHQNGIKVLNVRDLNDHLFVYPVSFTAFSIAIKTFR